MAESVPPKRARRVEKLAGYARPKDACSACYGSLIYALDRLDEEGRLDAKKKEPWPSARDIAGKPETSVSVSALLL